MATEVSYNGDGSNKTFSITFPFIKSDDVKVQVGTETLSSSAYSITGTVVTTDTAPGAGTGNVKLYRSTPIDYPVHDYSAGSTIRAKNLNDNQKQVLYGIEEAKLVTVTSGGITTGAKNDIHVNSDTDWYIRTDAVEQSMLADNSVGIDQIANDAVTTLKLDDDAVTADKLANSINTEIAANTAKVTNATHTGEVTGATALTIADNIIDEANLKIDNDPTNDYVLTAKSSAAGGLTWAAAAVVSPLVGFKTIKFAGSEVAYSNSWTDVTDLSITYTPTLSSSIIVLEAHLNISSRAQDQTSSLQWSNFVQQFIVTPTGGSAATVQEEQKFSTGASHNWGGNSSYGAFLEAKYHFYEEYTNSNTTEKTFKVQLKEVNGTLKVHDNSGHSYFTLKEYTP